MHAKDTSKKSKAGKKSIAKAGKFGGSRAAYGYIKDAADKHHLLIDPEAAETVKFIFQLACEGSGYKAIARRLRERGIENPNAYINRVDPTYHKSNYWRQPHDWHPSSIKTILHNETYLGKIVSGKRRVKSFKCKEIIKTPPEEWIIVENMHEPIIDQRTWNMAHENLKKRKRSDNQGAIQMFAGLLKCADCGYTMAFRQNPRKSYVCSLNNVKGKGYCKWHYILYDDLVEIVVHDIREKARRIEMLGDRMMDMIEADCKAMFNKKTTAIEKEMHKLETRAQELDTIIGSLYEDKALGKITPERFQKISEKYETEQREAQNKASRIQKSLDDFKQRASDIANFSEVISKYTHLQFLNSAILNELVERIEVGVAETVDGIKKQNVHIFYKQFSYYTFDLFSNETSYPPPHSDREFFEVQEAELLEKYCAPWENQEQATG